MNDSVLIAFDSNHYKESFFYIDEVYKFIPFLSHKFRYIIYSKLILII